jgi:zinc protease
MMRHISDSQVFQSNLPGPETITRSELPNGIVVLTRQNTVSHSVVLSGYISAGSHLESREKLGLAHFAAVALTRGTARQDFHALHDTIESAGASLGFGASVHTTGFGCRSLKDDLPLMLGLLSECLREPIFPSEEIERLRHQLLANLAIRAQNTSDVASLRFDEIVFKGHPYGRPEDGYVETITEIERADLQDFHDRYYGPKGMVIAITGAVEPAEAVDLVKSTLGDWVNESQIKGDNVGEVSPLASGYREHIGIEGKFQTDLVMGTRGPTRLSPDYIPASLGNNILGQFGLMGRIGDAVREQAGLAYHASTSLSAWKMAGSWEVTAGVNPSNLERAIDLIQVELQRFISEPVSESELSDSQTNFIGRLPLSFESNAGVANALLRLERYNLGFDYYQRYPDLVLQATPEGILEAANRYLDLNKLCTISAGSETQP